ncbi:MAG: hypothetical protein HC841_08780 [Verrucomicrobiae bacterium]|nr:hypothetical protein [Verrucomicrobiae bacterium]
MHLLTDRDDLGGKFDIPVSREIPDDVSPDARVLYICAFDSDEKLVPVIERILAMKHARFVTPVVAFPPARYFHRNDLAREVLLEEKQLPLGRFNLEGFENIIQALDMTREMSGDYVEIGVFQGRSAHLALNYMRRASIVRRSWFLDVFEGFTYEEAHASKDSSWSGTHQETSLDQVSRLLSAFDQASVLRANIVSDPLPAEIERIARETNEAMHDIVWLLKPGSSNLAELLARMREAAAGQLRNLDYQFECPTDVAARPVTIAFTRNVYLLFKEALANIVKHSRANAVGIEITLRGGSLHLNLRDDGAGFDPASVPAGNGLANMRRRAGEIGATLRIVSAPGKGTTVILEAPVR